MSLPEVEELRDSVEALLRLDAGGLGDAELHAAVVEVAGLRSRLEAAEAHLIAAWDNRRVWAADGSRSAAAALARATGSSRTDANRRCRRARRLRTMPATAEAFTEGSINAERVDVLCRANRAEVTDQFAGAEAMLVDHARTLDFDDLTRAVEYWSALADDARTADRAQRRHEQRHAHVDITLDGTYALRALLEGIGGEVFATEHDRIRHELWEHDWRQARADHGDQARPEHLARTAAQRGADALVEMARRAAAARAAGTSGAPPPPLITVLVDHETFTQRVCETARGVIIAPELLADALFEAEVERVVFGPANRTMHIGRKARFFRGALRRCIEIRDRWCTHPGCRVPADQCDIDHVTPWNRGGRTSLDNGRLLCGPHNRHAYQRQHQHPGPSPPAAA